MNTNLLDLKHDILEIIGDYVKKVNLDIILKFRSWMQKLLLLQSLHLDFCRPWMQLPLPPQSFISETANQYVPVCGFIIHMCMNNDFTNIHIQDFSIWHVCWFIFFPCVVAVHSLLILLLQ